MPSAIPPGFFMASASSPTKKRRREDNGEINNNERFAKPPHRGSVTALGVPFGASRRAIALPVSKKFRLVGDHHHDQLHSHYLDHNDFTPSAPSQQSQQSHFCHAHPEQVPAVSTSPQHTRPLAARLDSSALLSPCHICHRKPTKKSDLDSFGDCTGCGQRTCFVCLRACKGWLPQYSHGDRPSHHVSTDTEDLSASFTMKDADDEGSVYSDDAEKTANTQKPRQKEKKGEGGDGDGDGDAGWNGRGHRTVICSRCCVERGSEGEVVCLGCLAGMEGA